MPNTTPADNVHSLRRAEEGPLKPRVGLSWLDTLGLQSLVVGDAGAAVEHARGLAEALCGPEHDQVRLRTLSRSIAVARTEQGLLESMLLERLAKRDLEGVEIINKVLSGVTARMMKMFDAHRLESSMQRRVAVVVGHADQVNIDGGG